MTIGRAVGEIKDILKFYQIPNYVRQDIDKDYGLYDLLDFILEEAYAEHGE